MRKISLVIVLFFLFVPLQTIAQSYLPIVPCGGPTQPDCNLCHLFDMFVNIVTFVLVVVVPSVATVLLVWAGILFYTAMGDSSKILLAKKVLTNVIIAIVIIYGAHLFISILLNALGVVDGMQWPNIILNC